MPTLVPRRLAAVAAAGALALSLSACGGDDYSLEGVWDASDGSGSKTISDNGACSGMYYSNGEVLDIGGGMSCQLGDKPKDGVYTLVVRQPPNEATYSVKFKDEDTAVLMTRSGDEIVTLTRQ